MQENGKFDMSRSEFIEYIDGNFDITGDAKRLVNNILIFVENNYADKNERYNVLCELLYGIGLKDREIKKIFL